MKFTVNETLKENLYNDIYTDYVRASYSVNHYISHFYVVILWDWLNNEKKVLHIEDINDIEFFVKKFAYRDVIYIMKCPWHNNKDLRSRFNYDCINDCVNTEVLEEFDSKSYKYLNAIYNEFGVENYGEDNDPWQGRY